MRAANGILSIKGLANNIKQESKNIERILIPINLDYIRMYTGLPIFVDWKHHAFRYDQIIDWKSRVELAQNFFESKTLEKQLNELKKIQDIEYISHILIEKDKLKIDCNDLINHNTYMLISVKDCYDIVF